MALPLAAAGGAAALAYLDGKYQLRRDAGTILNLKRAERQYQRDLAADRMSPYYVLAETCARQPNDRAIWSRAGCWTFRELHEQTLRYANWMIDEGIRPGDLVAVYLQNSAHFLMLMFATLCIGAGPAMINYNLEGEALMHCLKVAETKLLIADVDPGCQRRIEGSREQIEGGGTKIVPLDDTLLRAVSTQPLEVPGDEWRKEMKPNFPFALIYTSGTTGLPKGCPFTISRLRLLGSLMTLPYDCVRGRDCWYSPMPLYHGTGLIMSSTMIITGIGVAIAPRFSVSGFWPDVHDSGSTVFIYVGETARYLLAAPPHPLERKHKLRCAFGNGLRPDVWQKFQDRFGIPEIAEFFNSSEGVFGMATHMKNEYLRGCVGHHGGIFRTMLRDIWIPVQVDYDSGDIWRNPETGFAKRTPYAEGGEIIVKVPSREAFGGYWRNPGATEKRFATDVFKKGDLYYRCGDALRRDPDGHWYFLDRLGDTFRWKSENVATMEVQIALGKYPGIAEANVYGVSVPGHEGRAGCAAIDLVGGADALATLDTQGLLQYCRARLPRYAVPVFLRIVRHSSHIHNHKQNKVGLRKEGVDPEKLGTEEKAGADDVFMWVTPDSNRYVPFRREDWDRLARGELRL